ncbi:DUF2779 domain-containing protein [Spiroplasma sp. SV19]|uniref:DUF2779 domain-containing protein n=1 Tax=Spiroplasma sp. SV19 TaxID=2570468 RepID=UPI0024B7D3C4|nr:DUF2779 domain-containing protein [Spiroplasma sp. SV19]WHQ37544.1 DUF2779 domain-containing protein [Spiroplasma sp. SV19]
MDSVVTLKKEDFKRFKKCLKIAWTLASRTNLKTVQQWVTEEKISVFFDLQDNINSAKINDSDFIDSDEDDTTGEAGLFTPNLYDLALETYWPAEKDETVSDDVRYLNDDVQSIVTTDTIEFYPGETIADGNEVGQRAREYFMRDHNYFNLEHYSKKIAFTKTTEVLADSTYDVYFEPSFIYNNCITKCDILKKLPDGTYHLIEVKASTGRKYDKELQMYVDKPVKDEYGYDVAYQYYVLTGAGLTISRVSLMLLNSEYYRSGDIDDDQLFMFQDWYKLPTKTLPPVSLLEFCQQMLTGTFAKRVAKNRLITDDLALVKSYLAKSAAAVLPLFTQEQCFNAKGDRYGYCQHATAYLPEHHSVFELTRGMEKKTLLKYQEHIDCLKDVILPFTFQQSAHQKKPILFSVKQQRQILATQDNAPVIDPTQVEHIKTVLAQYRYPLYMYDFETMKAAVPRFDYSYSYQQIPFQYSVHLIKDPHFNYHDEATMEHYAFLADGEEDPRLQLIEHLVTDLFRAEVGVYVAYYKSFECKVLSELINYLAILISKNTDQTMITTYQTWQQKLTIIRNKTIDLMDFFQDFMIYKKEFYGSASIKKTQPAFDNQFTYKALKVQKGDMASEIFRRRVENNIPITIWKNFFRTEMLKYCNRDTLAMVVIYQHIVHLMADVPLDKGGKENAKV